MSILPPASWSFARANSTRPGLCRPAAIWAEYSSGAASGRTASLISSRRISLPRKGCRVSLHIVLLEACSAFTRVAACALALSPICDTLIEGFSHFVTSITALIASGWSGCRVPGGTCPHWKTPPCHGAHLQQTFRLCVSGVKSGRPLRLRFSEPVQDGGLQPSASTAVNKRSFHRRCVGYG